MRNYESDQIKGEFVNKSGKLNKIYEAVKCFIYLYYIMYLYFVLSILIFYNRWLDDQYI